ncbi:hypothetical protein I4F81_001034 [Pyropia yezoensis]|uniref:Uncharacterized protein n=1 Tax=Pyropia yezoensis TaxID=2788 RepID=A0ACC3BL49_PYRYE|nr:hypothetical protein I4F81_001034 [Neopyropia yezoensis]
MAFVPAALPSLRRAHPPATCVRMSAGDGVDAPVSRAAFLRLAAVAGVSAAVSASGVPAASAFSIPNPFGGKDVAEKPAKTPDLKDPSATITPEKMGNREVDDMRERMAARRAANAEAKAKAAEEADKAALAAAGEDAKKAEEALKRLASDTAESVGGGQGPTVAPAPVEETVEAAVQAVE